MPRQRQEVEYYHRARRIIALAAFAAATAAPLSSRGVNHTGDDEWCTFLVCSAYAQKRSQSSKSGHPDRDDWRGPQHGPDREPQQVDRTGGSQSPDKAAREASKSEQQDPDSRPSGTTADGWHTTVE